ncbi:histone deacetylase family protein [Aliiglaciecola sp. LCG003]|uniref:histone deacetylase family protein n=1 Tax=Aliiglaciecola sp. LCG003 TaxID=3053655 RepID=UPI0025738A61|nr:histone deacetylase family protein [Aliiglaciecola sp. LCG003]WJG07879.1 histone deacetylase family protein [Aliiglaciecola sp. LCG003]
MSQTAFISHPSCLLHDMGHDHPESPDRIHAIQDAMIQSGLANFVQKLPSHKVSIDLLKQTHTPRHVERIQQHAPIKGQYLNIDEDTRMNHGSFDAALYAAGSGMVALDGIFDHKFSNAFCAIRPPGHHAEKDKSMGFCLFNNIAVAATYAQQQYKLTRIAIVDFDVHHGNGTEDIVKNDPAILFLSSYQYPFYPYAIPEKASANCLHYPLPAGTDSDTFRQCYSQRVLPELRAFNPQLILISAGFDGHRSDPLADWNLVDNDYSWLTKQLIEIADNCCEGRIVSFLEGGYSLTALSSGATAHIRALMRI